MQLICKFKNRAAAILLSLIASFSLIGAVDAHAAAADESPILYLEVSNTLTAQDTFAWTEYDHYNYTDRYLPTLDKHIVYEGDNIKMLGYGYAPLKDFLLVEDNDDSRKVLSFDIQRDRTDWHSMEGGGFLFNASVKNDTLSGFCILLTQSGLKLIDITGVNVNSFRNGSYAYVQNAGRLLATYPVNNVYAEHHIKIEINSSEISLWDDDKLLIDRYELPERDYGYGYGPITSHASHACYQQSYFTFSNIVMETVTGYYIKLEPSEDIWGLTNDYWTETFTLTAVDYTPAEGETIAEFSDYPMFKDARDMVLFYPDGSFDHIPWVDGKADYENAERYINIIDSNVNAGTIKLEPGEQIIGAYAE